MNFCRDSKIGIYRSLYKAPQGWGGVVAGKQGLLEVELPFAGMTKKGVESYLAAIYPNALESGKLTEEAAELLCKYFAGVRVEFDLPLDLSCCTEFQAAVYRLVIKIPYGMVKSYGAVAISLGRPKAARGVGVAMARNPLPVIIPCHRVVGKSGAMVGYSGAGGIDSKKWLLALEQARFASNI